jgi:hypothetical protein
MDVRVKTTLLFLAGTLAGVAASVRYDGRAFDYFIFRWRGLRIRIDIRERDHT